jgi:ferrochelatase
MENKSIFIKSGGTNYRYISALNDSEMHVNAIVNLLEQKK